MAKKKEEKSLDTNKLRTKLSRLSYKLGARYINYDADGKRDINTALNYLTQAMTIADSNPSEAERLLEMGRRISRK